MKYCLILLPVLLLDMMACQNNKEPLPCSALHPVSAKFSVKENHKLVPGYEEEWNKYEGDSFFFHSLVLTAEETDAAYTWKVGKSTYGNKSIEITFPYQTNNYPIRLTVQNTPVSNCFPKDDGIDTLTKVVKFIDPERSFFNGRFVGISRENVSITDTFTISTYKEHRVNIRISSSDKNICDRLYYCNLGWNILTFTSPLETYNKCNNILGGLAKWISKDSIAISYQVGTVKSHASFNFKGVRLNK